ncbi:hypothetical protein LXA52_17790, partial [Erwinia amylovora]|uniref:hypothetical protein n=1 Tax=Erwinia amylovora TaxID=552 RepID=UPI0020C0B451
NIQLYFTHSKISYYDLLNDNNIHLKESSRRSDYLKTSINNSWTIRYGLIEVRTGVASLDGSVGSILTDAQIFVSSPTRREHRPPDKYREQQSKQPVSGT